VPISYALDPSLVVKCWRTSAFPSCSERCCDLVRRNRIIFDAFHILQGRSPWLIAAEIPAILIVNQAARRSRDSNKDSG
jgi:hypothetical protein